MLILCLYVHIVYELSIPIILPKLCEMLSFVYDPNRARSAAHLHLYYNAPLSVSTELLALD